MELYVTNVETTTIRTVKIKPSNSNSWTSNSASWSDNNQNGQAFGFNVDPNMNAPFSVKMISSSGQTITSTNVITKREEGASGTMTQAFSSSYTEDETDNDTISIAIWIVVGIFSICCIGCVGFILYKKRICGKSRKEVTFDHNANTNNRNDAVDGNDTVTNIEI